MGTEIWLSFINSNKIQSLWSTLLMIQPITIDSFSPQAWILKQHWNERDSCILTTWIPMQWELRTVESLKWQIQNHDPEYWNLYDLLTLAFHIAAMSHLKTTQCRIQPAIHPFHCCYCVDHLFHSWMVSKLSINTAQGLLQFCDDVPIPDTLICIIATEQTGRQPATMQVNCSFPILHSLCGEVMRNLTENDCTIAPKFWTGLWCRS